MMGTEFINRTKKTIAKRIDTQRVALATPELFTVKPGEHPRSYVAQIAAGAKVASGESLIAEIHSGSVRMRRGNDVVVLIDNLPRDVVIAIEKSGGMASGVVTRVHRLSGKADVTLC